MCNLLFGLYIYIYIPYLLPTILILCKVIVKKYKFVKFIQTEKNKNEQMFWMSRIYRT